MNWGCDGVATYGKREDGKERMGKERTGGRGEGKERMGKEKMGKRGRGKRWVWMRGLMGSSMGWGKG